MKKREIIIIILVIVLLAGGLVGVKFYKKSSAFRALININTEIAMTQAQSDLYQELKTKLTADPNNYDDLLQLGRMKQSLLDFEGAISIYNQLLQRKPSDTLVLNNLGSIYFDTKRYAEAEAIQLRIIAQTPKWFNAYRELMSIYTFFLPENKAKLEPLLLSGLANIPDSKQEFTILLASYYEDVMKDQVKAIEYYEKALELNPTDQVIKAWLAKAKK